MRLLKGLAFVGALALASAASAELPVSPLGDIYESYNDCLKVAAPGGLKVEVLASLGWSLAPVTDKDGKPITDAPTIFGNPKRKPLIFLTAGKVGAACTVVARLENVNSFAEFKKAWGGKLPAADKDGAIGFIEDGLAVLLRPTGTAENPGLAMSVMIPAEKK